MNIAIQVRNLKKTFISQSGSNQKVKALDDVSIDIYQGEILGILGPNGAGKTTFLNTLSTLLLPDSGTIEILGIKSVPAQFNRLRKLLNMSSGYPNFPWSLTVEENLQFYGRLYGLSGKVLTQKIEKLIAMFELNSFAKRRFDELSSGTKQRLSLAKALINDPKIIFLDEPTVGLDPDVSIKTREIVMNVLKKSGLTVLLTTHNMQEAELMCERIAFVKEGKLLDVSTPQDLKRLHGKKDLEEVFVELAGSKTRAKIDPRVGESHSPENFLAKIPSQKDENFLLNIFRWFNGCYAFTLRNYLFALRNLFAFMELIFWPVVSLISIGLLGDYLQLQEKALAFIITGAITAGILQVTQLDVAYSLLYEVWSKSVKHTFLTPIGVSENLFGSWITGMVRGIAIFCILSVAAVALFHFKFPPIHVTAIFLFGIFCCALLLGLIVNILILSFGQKAEITAWMFAYIFMLICGIYYPIDTLPKFFYHLAQFIPITYFLEYFRQSFGFVSQFDHLLLKGFGLFFSYLMLGLNLTRLALSKARQKGILVRLSE